MNEGPVRAEGTNWSRWWGAHERQIDTALGIGITIGLTVVFIRVIAGSRPLDFAYIGYAFRLLIPNWLLSIFVTVVSFAIGLPIGFLVGWVRTLGDEPFNKFAARLAPPQERTATSRLVVLALHALAVLLVWTFKRFLRRVADGYVELVRGTPLFVQILFVWYLLLVRYPEYGPSISLFAGIIAMTVNTGGYQGEIFRGGLQTVHTGQLEAARAIGLTRWGAMRYIVLPQALRLVIPPLLNEFIGLFKASSLLFFIGLQELTFRYKQLANFESRIFELFVVVTVLYLIFTITLSKVVEFIERRYRIPGLGIGATRTPLLAPRRQPSA